MSRKTKQASAIALAAMIIFTIASAEGSGAFAQELLQGIEQQEAAEAPFSEPAEAETEDTSGAVRFISREVAQPLPEMAVLSGAGPNGAAISAASLEELVADMPVADGAMSKDMRCLAGAIYFESRGEPLLGQLAVGRVIVNRAESGRFPESYCGVVFQRSQFSFVRGGQMPSIDTGSAAWRNARAIAEIAHQGLWDSPAKGALFFHAAHVNPRWRLTRVVQVSSHIFYR